MSNEIEFEQTNEEVQPITPVDVNPKLKPGYIVIRLRSGVGGDVIVNEKNFGTVYKEDTWERVADKKK